MELDSLEVKVQSSAQDAASAIDKLAASLGGLKSAARGGSGLSAYSRGLDKLTASLKNLNVNTSKLNALKLGLSGLSGIKTHLSTTANQLNKLNTAMKSLDVDSGKMQQLVSTLNGLGQVQKASGLNSVLNSLQKIPKITKELSSSELYKFGLQIKLVTKYLSPLATEMEKVSKGFSAFPARIQRVIQSNERLATSSRKAAKGQSELASSQKRVIDLSDLVNRGINLALFRGAYQYIGGWLEESNNYVENLNLFTVAMGEYASAAKSYAEEVQAVMGIDASAWMRNQGVFQQMTAGFGVASEDAALMSKNLTQLGYDISSFYNIPIEEAMTKLQSGIAGEIEPLRRLGYAIDEASSPPDTTPSRASPTPE